MEDNLYHAPSKCPVCGNAMITHGRSASGAQRRRCATCALTPTASRADKARRCQLDEFLDWLLGAAPQRRRRESARNFRKRVGWCRGSPRASNPTVWCIIRSWPTAPT